MPELVRPTLAVMASFLEAMDEFVAEGAHDSQTAGWIDAHAPGWREPERFEAFVALLNAQEVDEGAIPRHWVLTSTRWWVDGEAYLGRIACRHTLNEMLHEVGGHIGYDVRPSARRQGHATAMLGAMLPHAHELGIDPALLTCDTDNVASRRTIEAHGGVLEDQRQGKLRFWVPTDQGGVRAGSGDQRARGRMTRSRRRSPESTE